MSKLLRWSVSGLGAALVLAVCASSYASLIPTYAPYNPGTTASYGIGAGDYQSRQDANSPNLPSPGPNDLLSATVGQGGGNSGLGITRIGLGELITPQTGSTYGSLNNHGLTVKTITMPLSGANVTVTVNITPGSLVNSATSTVVAPNDGTSTDVWTPSGSSVYTNTFAATPGGSAQLTYLDLAGANLADPVNNPAAPTLSLNQTYLVSLEWAWASTADNNNVVWYRGVSVDPGGQIMIELNQGPGFKTFAAAPFGAGAPRAAALAINTGVPTPEPGTLVLLGLAVPALWVARRRKV
jgi:hypothetical protein